MKDARGHGSNSTGAARGARYADSLSEPVIQAHFANMQAAAALAQGHPKSGAVPVHSAMQQQMEDHPAYGGNQD